MVSTSIWMLSQVFDVQGDVFRVSGVQVDGCTVISVRWYLFMVLHDREISRVIENHRMVDLDIEIYGEI